MFIDVLKTLWHTSLFKIAHQGAVENATLLAKETTMDMFTMRFVAALWNHANQICLDTDVDSHRNLIHEAISKALQDLGFDIAQIREILALPSDLLGLPLYSDEDVMTGRWWPQSCICLLRIVERAEKVHADTPPPPTPTGT